MAYYSCAFVGRHLPKQLAQLSPDRQLALVRLLEGVRRNLIRCSAR